MNASRKIDVAILGAVPQEVQNLAALFTCTGNSKIAGEQFKIGELQDKRLLVGVTGIGKVNAAITASAILTKYQIGQVWNVGCSGCFRQGSLAVGDVLITERFLCGDEGIRSLQGFHSSKEIGIPIVRKKKQVFFDSFPAGRFVAKLSKCLPPGQYEISKEMLPIPISAVAKRNSLSNGSFQLAYGSSLSVGMVSGDQEIARRRYLQYGALAENMEGSAIAQTCLRFDTPFVECRGMSNRVGERNKQDWQMEKALSHCHAILINWLKMLVS